MNPLGRAIDGFRAHRRSRRVLAEMRALTGSGYVPAAPVLSGTYVTPQTAMCLAAVYAAVNVISRDIASLPRGVYRRLPGGGYRPAPDVPAHDLIATAPNDELDAFRWVQATMGHVLGWGNSYSEIVRDEGGNPAELHPLNPAKIKAKRTKTGRLYYENTETDDKYLPENVLHFAGLGFNGLEGYSPITVARQTIGLAIGAEQLGAAFFGNGLLPKGMLKVPKRLSANAAANLRASMGAVHQGSQSAWQLMVLEEGMDWVNTQINPDDGQWLQTREFQTKDIARIFNVPLHKLGVDSAAPRANVEESNLDYVTMTLAGWVCMTDAQFNNKLLTARDRRRYVIRTDMSVLMRGNTTARTAYFQFMRNAGAMSADDIRIAEGLNPIGPEKGGDLYVVQGQYLPLNQIGKGPAEPAPEAEAEPAPEPAATPAVRTPP